jgi:hypothetical protein
MITLPSSSNPGFPSTKECLYFLAVCGVTVACLAAWLIYKLLKKRTQQAKRSVEGEGSDEMENLRLQLSSTDLGDEREQDLQSSECVTIQHPSQTSRPPTKTTLKMTCPNCKHVSIGIVSTANLDTKVSNAQSFASNCIWAATMTMGAYIIYKLYSEPTSSGYTGLLQLQ